MLGRSHSLISCSHSVPGVIKKLYTLQVESWSTFICYIDSKHAQRYTSMDLFSIINHIGILNNRLCYRSEAVIWPCEGIHGYRMPHLHTMDYYTPYDAPQSSGEGKIVSLVRHVLGQFCVDSSHIFCHIIMSQQSHTFISRLTAACEGLVRRVWYALSSISALIGQAWIQLLVTVTSSV